MLRLLRRLAPSALLRIVERHAEPEVADHLVAYEGEAVLLDAYDAEYGVGANRRARDDRAAAFAPIRDERGLAVLPA